MAFLTAYISDSSFRTSIDLVGNHRIFGLITFGLSAIAIFTGIMEQFGKLLLFTLLIIIIIVIIIIIIIAIIIIIIIIIIYYCYYYYYIAT